MSAAQNDHKRGAGAIAAVFALCALLLTSFVFFAFQPAGAGGLSWSGVVASSDQRLCDEGRSGKSVPSHDRRDKKDCSACLACGFASAADRLIAPKGSGAFSLPEAAATLEPGVFVTGRAPRRAMTGAWSSRAPPVFC
ncbi:MAG TPA: hypothetical protein VK446_03200 [Methylocystis sp.]|nr:hypothetical protein [Methylocystis sp.]